VHGKLDAQERRVALALCLFLPVLTLFWVAQTQIWNTYNLWARDHVDMSIGGWLMPVPWLQAVDALGVIVLMPFVLRVWKRQALRSNEPDDLTKLAIGGMLFGAAVAWLAAANLAASSSGKVPLVWALAYHFLSAIGYLYFAPVALAFFSRTAPTSINAMMIGCYYLAIFAGSTISGRLGGLYERLPAAQFWLIHAASAALGGLLILLLRQRLRREFKPRS
jgi:POT family proton-dependent oligopeptide transporter